MGMGGITGLAAGPRLPWRDASPPPAVPDLTDAGLVAATVAGDALAFEELMRRHYPAVWRVAFLSARDQMTAEEIAQDTFLRAYGALPQWRGDGSLLTWLCTICRRLCIDRARLRRPEPIPVQTLPAGEGGPAGWPAAPGPAETLPDRFDLQAALDALPGEEREAFLLVHHYGYSSFEAAGLLGIPASTLRSRVGRARQRLAAALSAGRSVPEGGEPA
jgi:RNA polymerase sigma-70 factor, ECF subfamily